MKQKLIGVFILLMGLCFLPMAGSDLKNTLTDKTPTALNWDVFVASKPDAGWYQINGAQLDLVSAIWVEENGNIGNIYVPARKVGGEMGDEMPIEMLVKVDDAQIRTRVEELKALDSGTDEAALNYVLQNQEELIVTRPLTGTLADGVDAVDSDDEKAIRRSDTKLANDFVILQEGAKPSLIGHLFMFGFGLVLTLGGLFLIVAKKVM